MGSIMSTTQVDSPAQPGQYLTFFLAGEMFAIAILGIKEIVEHGMETVVPMMPSFVRGVINLRGAVVPVVDVSARFGWPSSVITRRTCIVIIEARDVEGQGQDIGLLVDNVSAVMDIPAANIEPPPAFGARVRTDFIDGMAKVDGKFIIVLRVDQVLSIAEMAQLNSAHDTGESM